jgi:hypothetical protein
MTPFRKLRRLRFSLSSFLVALTIVCVWLGWQGSIVRERKALEAVLETSKAACVPMVAEAVSKQLPLEYRLSWARHLLGDREIDYIHIIDVPMDDTFLARISAAFPEANVIYERKFYPTPGAPDYYRPGPRLPPPYR